MFLVKFAEGVSFAFALIILASPCTTCCLTSAKSRYSLKRWICFVLLPSPEQSAGRRWRRRRRTSSPDQWSVGEKAAEGKTVISSNES